MKNLFKTAFLLTLLTLLFIWIGAMVGGRLGVMTAFIFCLIMNFGAYWFSDKIVLKLYRAQPVLRSQDPGIYEAIERLCASAGIPMPNVYEIASKTPNAFATGRDPEHAAVAVTKGIRQMLSDDELEGVLSHEIAHIKNRDTLIQTVVATIAGAVSMIAYMIRWAAIFGMGSRDRRGSGNAIGLLAMAIIAPIAAMLIQLAISRTREYQADSTGARISRKPLALASALSKLVNANARIPLQASTNTAHLFIVNPLSAKGIAGLFSTHPPLEERVARLKKIAQEPGL